MKRHYSVIVAILLTFFTFAFFHTSLALAATCAEQNGTCGYYVACPDGPPLSADDCETLQRCCPVVTTTCEAAGGRCGLPGIDCKYVNQMDGLCSGLNICCEETALGKGEIFCNRGDKDSGIMTAIGCIQTKDPNAFITSILRVATGIGGGLALMMILYGVFIVTTSAGIPDKLKMGSEIITSAVIGLIFILLSVFLVNLIGINILGIPGLS